MRREGATIIRIISVLQDDHACLLPEEYIVVQSRSNMLTLKFCPATRCGNSTLAADARPGGTERQSPQMWALLDRRTQRFVPVRVL
jgi:hypothetical protein